MAPTVADFLLERLRAWDVRHVFGCPGDGINGILAAWGRADNQPQFIQARHEEMAAFEAVGYAKFTGRVGACAATSGPGAIHLLNGPYDRPPGLLTEEYDILQRQVRGNAPQAFVHALLLESAQRLASPWPAQAGPHLQNSGGLE